LEEVKFYFASAGPPAFHPPLGGDERAGLACALTAYRAAAPEQADTVDEILAFVREEPRCFERGLLSGHITGSAWVVDRAGTATVLVAHRKLGRLLQPGGHADGDPDVRAVALREAREETGLTRLGPAGDGVYDVDVHRIPERRGEPAHLHYDVRFAFFADPDEPLAPNRETHGAAWVPLAGLPAADVDESVLRMARKTAALIARYGVSMRSKPV
jgi:8-oxo-dGTP pyrophosphatase MutT (NUDIX family)